MKIIVTGGCGFIGSNFVEYLLDKDQTIQIVVIDKLTYAGKFDNLPKNDRLDFFNIDIQSTDVEPIIAGADIVINFAAETHVDNSIKNANDFMETNYIGVYHLAMASYRQNIPKFIHISTDEVYGDPDVLSTELTPLSPNNPYAASKAAADMMLLALKRTYNIPLMIVRMTNNYGPKQHLEKMIPKTIVNALHDKCIPVYGNGQNMRDWLFVKDACRALELITIKGIIGEIYNVSARSTISNIDLVKHILQILNKPESLIRFVTDRPGHDLKYLVDSMKVRYNFGWKPEYNITTGLKETIAWYTNNINNI